MKNLGIIFDSSPFLSPLPLYLKPNNMVLCKNEKFSKLLKQPFLFCICYVVNFGNTFRTFSWFCAKLSKGSVSPQMIDKVSWEVSRSSLLITYYSAQSDEEHISSCKEMEFFKRKSLHLAYAKVLGFISPLMLNFWTFFLSGSFIRCEHSSFFCHILPSSERSLIPISEAKRFLFDWHIFKSRPKETSVG